MSHPFLVNMTYAFQDREYLYLIMDYINGGDLRYHIGTRKRFSESEAKFFIACIIIALQYLHKYGVIHRDIKPENLVFDDKGYLRLTDLGVSR
jgi:serine/threonine protein kinase